MIMEQLFKVLSCWLVFLVQPKLFIFDLCDSVRLKCKFFALIDCLLLASVQVVKPVGVVKSLHKVLVSAWCCVLSTQSLLPAALIRVYLRSKRAFLQLFSHWLPFHLIQLFLTVASLLGTEPFKAGVLGWGVVLLHSWEADVLHGLARGCDIRLEGALSDLSELFGDTLGINVPLSSVAKVVQVLDDFSLGSGLWVFSVFVALKEFWWKSAFFLVFEFFDKLSFLLIDLPLFVLNVKFLMLLKFVHFKLIL